MLLVSLLVLNLTIADEEVQEGATGNILFKIRQQLCVATEVSNKSSYINPLEYPFSGTKHGIIDGVKTTGKSLN